MADPRPVGARVVQMRDELVQVVDDARDRTWVGLAPGRFELPCTTACLGDGFVAGSEGLVEVEDLPEVGTDRVLVDLGDVRDTVTR